MKKTSITHREYFMKHKISVEQYAVLLVRLAFGGENTLQVNKGFDIDNSTIEEKRNCRIEVKSKVSFGPSGKASLFHCNDNKLPVERNGFMF